MGSKNTKPSEGRIPNNTLPKVLKDPEGCTEAFRKAVATAEASIRAAREAAEASKKAAREAAETLVTTFEQASNEPWTDAKGRREAEEVQRRIETRLESLTRMYSANETKQAEEQDEEED